MVVRSPEPDKLRLTGNKIWQSTSNSVFNDDILKVSSPIQRQGVFKENYGRKETDLNSIDHLERKSVCHIKNNQSHSMFSTSPRANGRNVTS